MQYVVYLLKEKRDTIRVFDTICLLAQIGRILNGLKRRCNNMSYVKYVM